MEIDKLEKAKEIKQEISRLDYDLYKINKTLENGDFYCEIFCHKKQRFGSYLSDNKNYLYELLAEDKRIITERILELTTQIINL